MTWSSFRTTTWEDHLKLLGEILTRIGEAGLTVKVDKCQFGMKQCVYLGHVVGNGMIQPEPSLVNWSEEIAKFLTAVNCFGLRQTALIVQAIGTRSTSQVASFKSRYKAKHPIWATYQPSSRLATKWKKTLPSPPQNTPPSNNLLPPHSALRLRYRWPTILVDVCIPFEGRPQALQGAPRSKNLKYEPLRQTRFEECSQPAAANCHCLSALDFKFKDLWTRIYPITQLLSSPYCNLTFWRPKLTDAEVVKIISQLFATPITWESATVGDNGPREEVLPNCELGDILDWDVQPSSPLPGTEVDRAQGTGWPFSPISPTQMDYSTAATPRETGE
ncbi:hypothetical protein EMCRGX_G005584 [Ephydatia muelleri]